MPLERSIDSWVCSVHTVLPAALGVADGVDRQQRGLGLHVVHVGGSVIPARSIATSHRVGDLADHRRPADVLRQQPLAHREADGEPRLVGLLGVRVGGQVAKTVACGESTPSVPPDQTIGTCWTSSAVAGALGDQHLAERPVGDDPGVVVDAAVALGLADHGDHPVGVEHAGVDQLREPARVGHVQDRDLADLDGVWHAPHCRGGRSVRRNVS